MGRTKGSKNTSLEVKIKEKMKQIGEVWDKAPLYKDGDKISQTFSIEVGRNKRANTGNKIRIELYRISKAKHDFHELWLKITTS